MAPEVITTDKVDKKVGTLTAQVTEGVFEAYHSPLARKHNGAALVNAFQTYGISGWIGLAPTVRGNCGVRT